MLHGSPQGVAVQRGCRRRCYYYPYVLTPTWLKSASTTLAGGIESPSAISTPEDSLLRTRTDQRAQRAAAGRARARTRARSQSPCKTAGETIHTFFHDIRSKPHGEKLMPLLAMVSREQTPPQPLRLTPEQKVFKMPGVCARTRRASVRVLCVYV